MTLPNGRAISLLLALSLQAGCYAVHERYDPPPEPLFSGDGRLVSLSDDGRWLVYVVVTNVGTQVESHLLDLETLEDVVVDGAAWTGQTQVVDLSGDSTTLLVMGTEVELVGGFDVVTGHYAVMDRVTRVETPVALDTSFTVHWSYITPHISSDGTRIAFLQCAEMPVPGCDIAPTILDRTTGGITSFPGDRPLESVHGFALSGDGMTVAYGSFANTEAENEVAFVCRTDSGTCTEISGSRHLRLSDDGRVAVIGLHPRGTYPELSLEMSIWRDGVVEDSFNDVYPVDLSGDATTALVFGRVGAGQTRSRLVLADGSRQQLQACPASFDIGYDRSQWISRDGRTVAIPDCTDEGPDGFTVFRW